MASPPGVGFQRGTTIRWNGIYEVIHHTNRLLYPLKRFIQLPIDIWPFSSDDSGLLGCRRVPGRGRSPTDLFSHSGSSKGPRKPGDCWFGSFGIEEGQELLSLGGEKHWKVCAKELITRRICVLLWRGGEGSGQDWATRQWRRRDGLM